MMGLLWRSKKTAAAEGKRKGKPETSHSSPRHPDHSSHCYGQLSAALVGVEEANQSPAEWAARARSSRQRSVDPDKFRTEQRCTHANSQMDDAFFSAVAELEGHRSSPVNEAEISVPLSNADMMPEQTAVRGLGTQFDHHLNLGEKVLDVSDTVDAPSLSLTLGPLCAHAHPPSQASVYRQGEPADGGDALSLTLRVPSSNQRAATGTLGHQHSWASNTRAATDSDVLEAPSLRLTHTEAPVHQTCSMDAEFNAQFTFPANVSADESGATAALTDDSHLAALCRDWQPTSSMPSPVHAAAYDGNSKLLQQLLQQVPDLEELWSDGGTPLHSAVQGDSCECVTVLLEGGAEIDCVNGDGITPLMLAAVMGHEEIMLLLLEHDADICQAFLPGSAEGLLHFCVEHEMVRGLKAVLAKPDGQLLATSTRLKPIYAALMSLAEACTPAPSPTGGPRFAVSPGAVAAAGETQEVTKARSVVDLLLAHSDLPTNASYDDLIQHAHASYTAMETLGGSSVDTIDYLLSPADRRSSASPGAFDPESSRASSRHSGKRLVFTPTANLDCSPANCSPISVFGSERSCTPSATSRYGLGSSLPAPPSEASSPLLAGSASVGHSSSVGGFDGGTPRTPTAAAAENGLPVVMPQRLYPKKPLRVRTRIPE